MTNREAFMRWLYHFEGLTAEEVRATCTAFDELNVFVQNRKKDTFDLFVIETEKEYNDQTKKWLNLRTLKIYFKENAENYIKHLELYKAFRHTPYYSDFSALETAGGIPAQPTQTEWVETHEDIETTAEDGFGKDENAPEMPTEEVVVAQEQIESPLPEEIIEDVRDEEELASLRHPSDSVVKSYIETLMTTTLDTAQKIAGRVRKPYNRPEKVRAGIYYDLVNELAYIDADEHSCLYDLDSYAYIKDDKPLKRHKDAIRDYHKDATTYAAICGLDEKAIRNGILERAITDAAADYRADDSKMFCLMPDILDDFHKEIRRQISYNGKRLFTVPKSVALLTAERLDGNLQAGKTYCVIDFDGDEVSATCLETVWDEVHNEVSIIRRGLTKINSEVVGYTSLSKLYLKAYSKLHKTELGDDLIERLSESKFLYRLFRDKEPVLVAEENRYVQIDYDERLHHMLERDLDRQAEQIWNELNLQNNIVYVVCSLFPNRIGCSDLKYGCQEIARRLQAGEPLWKEYLPHLTLEVKSAGGFRDIELIRKNEYRDVLQVLNSEECISVDRGEITLSAGEQYFALPLERDVIGNQNQEKMARLESKYFPLEKDLRVKLEIHYRYGDEDSYRLRFIPLDKEAVPFAWLESEWYNAEPVERITPPEFKIRDLKDYSKEIDQMREAAEQVSATFEVLHNEERLPYYVKREIQKDGRGMDQSSLFWRFNYYGSFRKVFSPSVLFRDGKKNDGVAGIFETLYKKNFFSNMLGIVRKEKEWKDVFVPDEAVVVRKNALQHLSNFSLLYAQKLKRDVQALLNDIVGCIVAEDKLDYLAALTRCIGKDQDFFGVFDAFNRKIIKKIDAKKLDYNDLRKLSSNCWETEAWIENVYFAENGVRVIEVLIEKCICYIEDFDFEKDLYQRDRNPRFVRDVMELLLCLTRADPLHERATGKNFIDPNSKRIKLLIKKIKEIDRLMTDYVMYLTHPFVSRLHIETNVQNMTSVNEISYMLISTLSGGGNFSLIGFEED